MIKIIIISLRHRRVVVQYLCMTHNPGYLEDGKTKKNIYDCKEAVSLRTFVLLSVFCELHGNACHVFCIVASTCHVGDS